MPSKHALLGPSGAHRWMVCTPSARLEEGIEDNGSAYANEGTLAHQLVELLLRRDFGGVDGADELADIVKDPLFSTPMMEYAEGYVTFVGEKLNQARTRCSDPLLFIEREVSISEYAPKGFGTVDCGIIADGFIEVIDFKYGVGVPVSAKDNPQMKAYSLGYLLEFDWSYDIQAARMTIYQPRLDNISTETISSEELMDWAEHELKPKAALAWAGQGAYCPGEHQCRWCKAKARCRAHAEYQMQLAAKDFIEADLLEDDEIAEILERLPGLVSWANQVKKYAQDKATNHGAQYPGFKVVEKQGNRYFSNERAVVARLKEGGFSTKDLYTPKELLGITAMTKLVGKDQLESLVGEYIVRKPSSLELVSESVKRPAFHSAAKAAEDFTE